MRTKFKRLTAVLLAAIMAVSCMSTAIEASAAEVESSAASTDTETDISVSGSNSFGSLLSDQLEEAMEDSDADVGEYGISDIVVEGNTATVTYYAATDCTIVVALYDEESGEMLASGNGEVSANDEDTDSTVAEITIDTDLMPEYFALKGFIIDSENNPLSENYVSSSYTEAIQFVKNMVVSDFDSEYVLNLDEDETTNFAVFSEDTKIIPYTEGYNIPENTSPDDGIYVFTNCNDDFKSLSEGDAIAYTYGNEIMLIKIASIEVDGDTVTVTESEEIDIDTFFEYVKIETEATTQDAVYDGTEADPSVTFNGFTTETDSVLETSGIHSSGKDNDNDTDNDIDTELNDTDTDTDTDIVLDDTISDTYSAKFTIGENKGSSGIFDTTISATVTLSITLKVDFYYNASWDPTKTIKNLVNSDLEFSEDIKLGFDGTIKATADIKKVKLGSFGVMPIVGVYIDFSPTLKCSVSGSLTFNASVSKHFGFSYTTEDGLCDKSTPTKVTSDVKLSGKLYLGVDLGPEMKVMSDKLITIELKMEAGFEISGTLTTETTELTESKHTCAACYSGNVTWVVTFGVSVKVFQMFKNSKNELLRTLSEKFSVSKDFSAKKNLCNYYYSLTYGDSGFYKTCPHKSYRITFTVSRDGIPVSDTAVCLKTSGEDNTEYTEAGETDSNGTVTVYLEDGDYTVSVDSCEKEFSVNGKAKTVTIDLVNPDTDSNINTTDTNSSETDGNNTATHENETTNSVTSGTCGNNVEWALYESGTLYIYGTGAMTNYSSKSSTSAPWYSNRTNIKNIIIEFGVTSIGNYAFYNCNGLQSITIPNSVTSIGNYAFYY